MYHDSFNMKLVNHAAMRFNTSQSAKCYQLLLYSFNPHGMEATTTEVRRRYKHEAEKRILLDHCSAHPSVLS